MDRVRMGAGRGGKGYELEWEKVVEGVVSRVEREGREGDGKEWAGEEVRVAGIGSGSGQGRKGEWTGPGEGVGVGRSQMTFDPGAILIF